LSTRSAGEDGTGARSPGGTGEPDQVAAEIGPLAARPGTINAVTPVAGSFVSDQAPYAVAGQKGYIAVGRIAWVLAAARWP
jgi:hypothetical protein